MRTYIAGPMRNIKLFNFPAFDAAAERLRAEGHEVVNPADIDREFGAAPEKLPEDYDWSGVNEQLDLPTVALADLEQVIKCDGIYMLPRWEFSDGATAEHATAKWLGKEIRYAKEPTRITIGLPCTPEVSTSLVRIGPRKRIYIGTRGVCAVTEGFDEFNHLKIRLTEIDNVMTVNPAFVPKTEEVVLWKQEHRHTNKSLCNPKITYFACPAGVELIQGMTYRPHEDTAKSNYGRGKMSIIDVVNC